MVAKGVSGVAILERGSGNLVGHLGASDLRCLAPGVFSRLLLPVRDFLAERVPPAPGSGGATAGGDGDGKGGPPLAGRVLCAQPSSSLGALAAAMAGRRVHRVYATDSDSAPVGVVTCSDLLAVLLAGTTQRGPLP